jgi:hypothetical protein
MRLLLWQRAQTRTSPNHGFDEWQGSAASGVGEAVDCGAIAEECGTGGGEGGCVEGKVEGEGA